MPIGTSGRIVIEVEPELKRALYRALKQNGSSLKDWFVNQAESYLNADQRQLEFFAEDEGTSLREERAG